MLQHLAKVASTTPALNTALLNVGIPESAAVDPQSVTFTAQQQRLIYIAMTQITGTDLQQILSLLRVTTAGLTTMADLLNPVKTFPRSYNTLTAPTANGLRGIYINSSGAVNSRLETELPASVLSPLTGNPLQNMSTQDGVVQFNDSASRTGRYPRQASANPIDSTVQRLNSLGGVIFPAPPR